MDGQTEAAEDAATPLTTIARLRALADDVAELSLPQVAAGIAFWLLLAVFPAGLVVVDVAGLVTDQESVARAVGRVAEATPGSLGDLMAQQLVAVAAPSPGSFLSDAVLVVLAVWTISTAMHHLVRGIQLAYGSGSERALVVRLLGIFLAVAALVALGGLAWVLDAATLLGSIAGYASSFVVVALLTGVVYWVSVGRGLGLRRALPGALVAAVGIVAVAVGVELYAGLSGNLKVVYGTVAGFVVSMLALWLSVLVVLVGARVNGLRAGVRRTTQPRRF